MSNLGFIIISCVLIIILFDVIKPIRLDLLTVLRGSVKNVKIIGLKRVFIESSGVTQVFPVIEFEDNEYEVEAYAFGNEIDCQSLEEGVSEDMYVFPHKGTYIFYPIDYRHKKVIIFKAFIALSVLMFLVYCLFQLKI